MLMLKKIHYLLFLCLLSSYVLAQEGKTIAGEECDLHYRIWGEGKPVLYINGGPGFSSLGSEIYAKMLSESRQVILYDQRGTGQSTCNQIDRSTIATGKMLEDIELLRKTLNVERWDIIGHSFGATLAVLYANEYPERLHHLVLSAPVRINLSRDRSYIPVFNSKLTEKERNDINILLKDYNSLRGSGQLTPAQEVAFYRGIDSLRAGAYIYNRENLPKIRKWFLERSEKNRTVNSLVWRNLEWEFPLRYDFSKEPDSTGQRPLLHSTKGIELRENLRQIPNKVLIIIGEHDCFSLYAAKDYHELFLNSELNIIAESGHSMTTDAPKIYWEAIRQLLEEECVDC